MRSIFLSSVNWQKFLPLLSVSIAQSVLFVAVLSLVLTSTQAHDLPPDTTATWIFVLYGLAGVIGLVLSLMYRQPFLFTGNVFLIIFVGTVGGQITYPELVGASMVAGLVVGLVTILRLTHWIARLIPTPIVMGLLAGAILPFVSDIFTLLGQDTVLIGGILIIYFLSRRFLGRRIPPILPALIGGILIAVFNGQTGQITDGISFPTLTVIEPVFSLDAIVSITPILVVLLTVQANVPSIIFLRSQGYDPPERLINGVSSVGTMIGSFLGPTGISISLPASALVAGEAAGDKQLRYIGASLTCGASILIALLAGVSSDLPQILPRSLLLTLAGLALLDVLIGALQHVTAGPLRMGPMLAFVIALSDISLFGFGAFFWSLAIGIAVTYLLERDKLRLLQTSPTDK